MTINKVSVGSLVQSNGCIYVNAYAQASDGITTSSVYVDYADLELTIKIGGVA